MGVRRLLGAIPSIMLALLLLASRPVLALDKDQLQAAVATNDWDQKWLAVNQLASVLDSRQNLDDLQRQYGNYKDFLTTMLKQATVRVHNAPTGSLSDDELESFVRLIQLVGTLHEHRALPALLDPEILQIGGVAYRALRNFGTQAVIALSSDYWISNGLDEKFYIVMALVNILDSTKYGSDPKLSAAVKSVLLDATSSRHLVRQTGAPTGCFVADCSDSNLRVAGTRGLVLLKSPDAMAVLLKLRDDSDRNVRKEAEASSLFSQ